MVEESFGVGGWGCRLGGGEWGGGKRHAVIGTCVGGGEGEELVYVGNISHLPLAKLIDVRQSGNQLTHPYPHPYVDIHSPISQPAVCVWQGPFAC